MGVRGLEGGEFGLGVFECCDIVQQFTLHLHFAYDFEAEINEESDGGGEVVDDDADVIDVPDLHACKCNECRERMSKPFGASE